MPSRMASSVAYSLVSSTWWTAWPGTVATGSLSPNASTEMLPLVVLAA